MSTTKRRRGRPRGSKDSKPRKRGPNKPKAPLPETFSRPVTRSAVLRMWQTAQTAGRQAVRRQSARRQAAQQQTAQQQTGVAGAELAMAPPSNPRGPAIAPGSRMQALPVDAAGPPIPPVFQPPPCLRLNHHPAFTVSHPLLPTTASPTFHPLPYPHSNHRSARVPTTAPHSHSCPLLPPTLQA